MTAPEVDRYVRHALSFMSDPAAVHPADPTAAPDTLVDKATARHRVLQDRAERVAVFVAGLAEPEFQIDATEIIDAARLIFMPTGQRPWSQRC